MKERPILFNGPMVRAILDGRKTQTRRVVSLTHVHDIDDQGVPMREGRDGIWHEALCPYGQTGDRLWVRENTWVSDCGDYYARCYGRVPDDVEVFTQDGRSWPWVNLLIEPVERCISRWSCLHFATRKETKKGAFQVEFCDLDPSKVIEPFTGNATIARYEAKFRKLVPSIHMPRWASRITLEITGVRVERLQDITEADAKAEGLHQFPHKDDIAYAWKEDDAHGHGSARGAFSSLWDSLATPGTTWADNPWVWVVEFKRVETSCPA